MLRIFQVITSNSYIFLGEISIQIFWQFLIGCAREKAMWEQKTNTTDILDFQPPAVWENKFLLFCTTQSGVLCYDSFRKLIHMFSFFSHLFFVLFFLPLWIYWVYFRNLFFVNYWLINYIFVIVLTVVLCFTVWISNSSQSVSK